MINVKFLSLRTFLHLKNHQTVIQSSVVKLWSTKCQPPVKVKNSSNRLQKTLRSAKLVWKYTMAIILLNCDSYLHSTVREWMDSPQKHSQWVVCHRAPGRWKREKRLASVWDRPLFIWFWMYGGAPSGRYGQNCDRSAPNGRYKN